mgnify:CR=1 FL=1
MTRFASVLGMATAALVVVACSNEVRAQSASPAHFNRTRSGGSQAVSTSATAPRRSAPVERTSTTRLGTDLLAPYTSKAPIGSYVARSPEPRPTPTPVVRNYFPTARSGQVQHHCTPSRGAVYARGR